MSKGHRATGESAIDIWSNMAADAAQRQLFFNSNQEEETLNDWEI